MTTPSDAYIIDCATYGDPPRPPLPEPVDGALDADATAAIGSYDDPSEAPEAIPGLWILGSTYNVLNGKYADPKSTMQQVIDYSKSKHYLRHDHGLTLIFLLRRKSSSGIRWETI